MLLPSWLVSIGSCTKQKKCYHNSQTTEIATNGFNTLPFKTSLFDAENIAICYFYYHAPSYLLMNCTLLRDIIDIPSL